MKENEKVTVCQKKLAQLKEEEALILKLLKDVQKQLKKYEVEELETCSELISSKGEESESESDESVDGNPETLLKLLDCAQLVNDSSLDLGLNKILGDVSDDENSEESEESD